MIWHIVTLELCALGLAFCIIKCGSIINKLQRRVTVLEKYLSLIFDDLRHIKVDE